MKCAHNPIRTGECVDLKPDMSSLLMALNFSLRIVDEGRVERGSLSTKSCSGGLEESRGHLITFKEHLTPLHTPSCQFRLLAQPHLHGLTFL